MDTDKLRKAIMNELATAPSPYQGTIGLAYLDNAWMKGAEYMADHCLRLIASKELEEG